MFQINQIKRSFLKITFNTDAARQRAFRAMYRSLILRGRKLRLKGAARNSVLANKLYDKGCKLNRQALTLDECFPTGNGRTLTLALAFLNGTPYNRCETNPKSAPNWQAIAEAIKGCLPKDHQEKATRYIEMWRLSTGLTLKGILDAQEAQAA